MAERDGFLARWSRRKAGVDAVDAVHPALPAVPEPVPSAAEAAVQEAAEAAVPALADATGRAAPIGRVEPAAPTPAPTLEDAAALKQDSDFRPFVRSDVEPAVKNAALKKLFADPHFNVMDGLDTYIDDYGKPDPLPEGMLRKMVQSQFLGLFADEKIDAAPTVALVDPAASAAPALADNAGAALEPATDENAAVRLQPDDAAGPPGPEPGAGENAGRKL